MDEQELSLDQHVAGKSPMPLLFQKREYLESIDAGAATTSCQTTSNPDDYGPDD